MLNITLTDAERNSLRMVLRRWKNTQPPNVLPSMLGPDPADDALAFLTAALRVMPRLALASLTPDLWWDAEDHEMGYPDLVEVMDSNEHGVNEVHAYDPAVKMPRVWVASLPTMLDIDDGVEEWDDPEAVAFATEAEALAAVKQRMAELRAALTGEEGRPDA